jgi:hypothetical protein
MKQTVADCLELAYEAILQGPKRTEPTLPITDPSFVYRPAAATDITITWRRFGWVPVEKK